MQPIHNELSFHEEVLQVLPDAVMWTIPVRDAGGAIIDFEIRFANKKAIELIGPPSGSLYGLRVRRDQLPSAEAMEQNFCNLLQAYEAGTSDAFSFYIPHTHFFVETVRQRFRDGVLSAVRDRRALREAQLKEYEKTELLDGIIKHAPTGILAYEAMRSATGTLVDFRIKLYNQQAHELTGIAQEERSQLTFKALLDVLKAPEVFERYHHVTETGEPFALEYLSPRTHRWLHLSVGKLGDGFLIMLTDMTGVKASQQALQQESAFSSSILNASLNGIYVLEALRDASGAVTDFRFIRCNERFAELTGWPVERFIGQSFLTLFPHIKETGLFAMLSQVIENNEPHRQEMYYAQFFNRWYDYMAVRLGDDKVVVTFQEITQQREAALQIEQQKNLLDNILQYSPAGISVTEVIRDQEGRIVDGRTILANDSAIKYIGISKEDFLTKTVRQVDPALFDSPVYQMALTTLLTGTPFYTQYFFEPASRWLELSVAKMDDEHLINVFTDITATKEAQIQLETLVAELKRSNANLEEFAYAASHDLQEPLRKIYTFSDRLKQDLAAQLTSGQQRLLERIQSASQRMRQLIGDLLAYSNVSQKQKGFEPVDLNIVLKEVVSDLEASIVEKGAILNIDELPTVQGDKGQLRQLFQNLISNALKYAQPGLTPHIRLTCRLLDGSESKTLFSGSNPGQLYHFIQVIDNGIGFAQENAEKIFQVFQRLHGRSEYEGTGVGLAIVQRVVTNHKGYISAQSQLGKGATFSLLLPA